MHLRVPALLREQSCDLFWATLSMLPLGYRRRASIPAIVNFHDLNAFIAPETMVTWNRWQHRLLDHRSLLAAERVLCLSATTRADIVRVFPDVDEKRLTVVYPGTEPAGIEARAPAGPVGKLEALILCVGTLEPRKNQATVLEAYLQASSNSVMLPLVFVGRYFEGWGDASLVRKLQSGELEKQGVFFLENSSAAELQWCYEKAALFVLASRHEGFGLPVIEAYSNGCPALLSDIPIFREIGSNAVFVPPHDTSAWARALQEFNRSHQEGRAPKPEFNADLWSWEKRAELLASVIDETGSQPMQAKVS